MNSETLQAVKVDTHTTLQAQDLNYLHVQKSLIQGLGLFTSQYIPANKILFRLAGRKVYREYTPEYAKENLNWMGISFEQWLEIESGDTGVYVNHSCKPNVLVNEHMEFISIKPIHEGEELLLDYSTTELDPYWSMKCTCGQSCCRKTLLSFQYLPKHLQQHYSRYLSPAILKGSSLIV